MQNDKTKFDKTFVAIFDVLGFSSNYMSLSNEQQEDYYKRFEDVFTKAVYHFMQESPNEKEYEIDVNTAIFSDTICVWSNKLSHNGFLDIVTVSKNLLRASFDKKMPLRGAISMGSLFYEPLKLKTKNMNMINLVHGTGLINAHEIEKNKVWSGCVIDSRCINEINEEKVEKDSGYSSGILFLYDMIKNGLVERYSVPIRSNTPDYKQYTRKEEFIINWKHGLKCNELSFEEHITRIFHGDVKKDYNKPVDEYVKLVIENTVEYLKTHPGNN